MIFVLRRVKVKENSFRWSTIIHTLTPLSEGVLLTRGGMDFE
jgi:hypothetical protein